MLSRLVIAFLPRSKHLLISWLQSPSAVILEPPKIVCLEKKCFLCSPSICHEVMGPDAMILVFWMLSFKPTFSQGHIFSRVLLCFYYDFRFKPCKKEIYCTVWIIPSRWTDGISKELKMITELSSQNLIYAYKESYSHIIVFLAPCGIVRTLIEAIYKRNYFIMIVK